MPDDVGGQPFPDGEGPDSRDLGAADEAFAAVVLDDTFIEAAQIHEPTAEERMIYARLERAEAESAEADADLPAEGGAPDSGGSTIGEDGLPEPGSYYLDGVVEPDGFDEQYDDEGRFDRSDYTRFLPPGETGEPDPDATKAPRQAAHDAARPRPPRAAYRRAALPGRRPTRWQRPVACVLAMVMGLSVIAFSVVAVQRAGAAQRGAPRVVPPPPPATGADTSAAGPTATGPTASGPGSGGTPRTGAGTASPDDRGETPGGASGPTGAG